MLLGGQSDTMLAHLAKEWHDLGDASPSNGDDDGSRADPVKGSTSSFVALDWVLALTPSFPLRLKETNPQT